MSPDELAALITGFESALDPFELSTLAKREGANLLSTLITMRREMQVLKEQAIENEMLAVAISADAAQRANLEIVARLIAPFVSRDVTEEVRRVEIVGVPARPVDAPPPAQRQIDASPAINNPEPPPEPEPEPRPEPARNVVPLGNHPLRLWGRTTLS